MPARDPQHQRRRSQTGRRQNNRRDSTWQEHNDRPVEFKPTGGNRSADPESFETLNVNVPDETLAGDDRSLLSGFDEPGVEGSDTGG